jgi:putative aldouronate transport system permease protein
MPGLEAPANKAPYSLKNLSLNDYYFIRVLRNTVVISFTNLIFSFPVPIILALLINELKSRRFSRLVQTVTYMPHFISVVVICSMIVQLTVKDGAINQILSVFGCKPVTMLNQPKLFLPIYIISGIWQNMGWNSIIYLSALINIDQELYTAAKIDGANRFRQLIHITLPGLMPTVIIMLILQTGKMFNVGHEKILLLYNELTYETAEVISTYVYKKGLLQFNWSYSTAVGLFNSVVCFILVYTTNRISRATSETSLW